MDTFPVKIIVSGTTSYISCEPGTTVGDLFNDSDFREEYGVADRAIPTISTDGNTFSNASNDTVLQASHVLKPEIQASSKS